MLSNAADRKCLTARSLPQADRRMVDACVQASANKMRQGRRADQGRIPTPASRRAIPIGGPDRVAAAAMEPDGVFSYSLCVELPRLESVAPGRCGVLTGIGE
jgi:hypothetical protein